MDKTNILHGSIISPYVRKVLIVLKIKEIPHTVEEITPFIPPHREKLLQLSPLGKIPIYQENDVVIPDSSVICAYLEKKYPEKTIYPKNAGSYAKCLWFEEYADTQLIPALITVFFHTVLAPILRRGSDPNIVEIALQQQLPRIFDYLDHEIGDKNYLLDDRLTLADISLVTAFLNFEFAGRAIDAGQWKNLGRYIESISQENAVKEAFDQARDRLAMIHLQIKDKS